MRSELVGRTLRLRPLQPDDLVQRSAWTADPELRALMGVDTAEPTSGSPAAELRANQAWLRGRLATGDALYALEVAGRYSGDLEVVLDTASRQAELSLFIGDRAVWGHGYGSAAVRLVLAELAQEPAIDRVLVDVAAVNERALAFWLAQGFELLRTDEAGVRWLQRATHA